MENFVLLLHESQLDHCVTENLSDAHTIFATRGWVIGDILTIEEYQDELRLNAMENESV